MIDTGAVRVYVAAETVEILADHQLDATPSADGTGFLLAPQDAESVQAAGGAQDEQDVQDESTDQGAESPVWDATSPVWDAGSPAEEAESPVWEAGSPVWEAASPDWHTASAEWPERAWNAESPQDPEGPGGSGELF